MKIPCSSAKTQELHSPFLLQLVFHNYELRNSYYVVPRKSYSTGRLTSPLFTVVFFKYTPVANRISINKQPIFVFCPCCFSE